VVDVGLQIGQDGWRVVWKLARARIWPCRRTVFLLDGAASVTVEELDELERRLTLWPFSGSWDVQPGGLPDRGLRVGGILRRNSEESDVIDCFGSVLLDVADDIGGDRVMSSRTVREHPDTIRDRCRRVVLVEVSSFVDLLVMPERLDGGLLGILAMSGRVLLGPIRVNGQHVREIGENEHLTTERLPIGLDHRIDAGIGDR